MNRDKVLDASEFVTYEDLINQVAYHEAGHAAAIYLRNRQMNLPPVYFHISITGFEREIRDIDRLKLHPLLEGGLLHTENLTMVDNRNCASIDCEACRAAYDADVINLMAGPIAEAWYVARRDGEEINQHLLNFEALKNYGGSSDLEKVEQYLAAFTENPYKRKAKLDKLFAASFEFVSRSENWRAISRLANYIAGCKKEIVSHHEATAVLSLSA